MPEIPTMDNDLMTLDKINSDFEDYVDLDGEDGGEINFTLNGETVTCVIREYVKSGISDLTYTVTLTKEQYVEFYNYLDIDYSPAQVVEKLTSMELEVVSGSIINKNEG